MSAFNLYVGTYEKDGRPIGLDAARDIIFRSLRAEGITDATLTNATGIYQGQTEPAVVIYLSGITREDVKVLARRLLIALNQTSIGLAETPELWLIS